MRPPHWLFALLCAVPIVVHAQLRTIPGDAKAGLLRYVNDTQVAIDGVEQRLAPGAQVRDQANRIVFPAAVPAGSRVKYLLDARGEVHQVWILTPEEAAMGRAAK